MGLYMTCSYPKFSTEEVGKFERRLKKWCNEACAKGISMLVFDQKNLKVEGTQEIWYDNYLPYHELILPNITLTYTRVVGTPMCIMYKIWENQTNKILYQMPSKWEGTELWLGE